MGDFKGRVLGVEYSDRDEFERAARGAGYTHVNNGRRAIEWKTGTEVRVEVDDRTMRGQVWARAEKGWVWLALENRTFVAVSVSTLEVRRNPGISADNGVIGRVA